MQTQLAITPSMTQKTNRQRGFFVAPLLISVAVVLALAGAAYGIYQYASNVYTTNIENSNLMSIVSAAKSLKSGGSYTSVDNAALQRIKAFGGMTGAAVGGTVRNRWNGTVVVTGTASQLEIVYNGVPTSACDRFLTMATNSGEFAAPLPTCSATAASDLTFIAY